jgi:DNA-binding IclR family transcriptional regulator
MTVATPTKKDIYYIEVLGKALDVLDVFTRMEKPALTLQELSRETGLNKNTVFRVLYTLAEHGYVVKRGHEYELGAKLAELGTSRLRRGDLLAVAGPQLDQLRTRFSETVNLGVLDGGSIRYVDVRESHHRFRLAERIGGSDFLHCTALGKATLAFLPFEEVRPLLKAQGMHRQTASTITNAVALKAELARVKEQGYAVDREESMEGAFCVAAPVLDSHGRPVAAISISGPTTRFGPSSEQAAADALRAAAAAVRAGLGYL